MLFAWDLVAIIIFNLCFSVNNSFKKMLIFLGFFSDLDEPLCAMNKLQLSQSVLLPQRASLSVKQFLRDTNQNIHMKFIPAIILLLTCHLASAQFVKGDKFIAGGYSVSVQNSSNGNGGENKHRSFQVYPEVGFFLNSRYAVGGGLTYSSGTSKFDYGQGVYQTYKNQGFGLYIFVKRYFSITEKFFFSLDGSVAYDRARSTTEISGAESTNKSYIIGFNATPSLIFFPSDNWAIEGSIGSLGLSHSRGLSDESKSTKFDLNYGSISFGFAYFFRNSTE